MNDLLKRAAHLTSAKRFHQLLVLLLAGCLTTMTGSVIFPVLPEMVQQLALDPQWAGTLASIHALTSALCTPILGVVADRLGKLKVMVPCLILYAIFGLSTAFLTTMPLLLTSRGLLGAASGGVAAATIGILGGMYEGETRSRILGYATSAMTTAAIFFPLLGGWVGGIQWQFAFYLYGLGIPLAVIAALVLRENASPAVSMIQTSQNQQLSQLIRNRSILTVYLFIWAAGLMMYAVVVYTPLYLKQAIGATPEINGIVLAVRLVGAALISAFGASRISQRIGPSRAVAFGFSLMAMAIVTIPFLTELYLIIPTAMLFGAGFGIITPNLYDVLAGLAPLEVRTTVLAIGTGFNSLGQFISPVILGPIWKYAGLPPVFYVAGAIAAIASGLSLTVVMQPNRAPS
ncbi:MFS transporter [Leptolyngbya sp. FACHB-711]|uniref:MFS transporter n=1 Tax=Leptolyngbya sp. FACHB-711 TaxID=2692813 RepID=UPI001689296B|nr:MFS transporter [Leptolyngbya sp. FACHB-711]MBD1853625.1 MFS transporter [Cyanobacteria bacterium FACHB-502]MBD2023878.1 MFS transporter [Leptolyngbya sp. FACHB-711]